MIKRTFSHKLVGWVFWIIFGLLMVLELELFFRPELIWGKNVGKVADIVNILCIMISVGVAWVFVLGPRIRRRK
jgi:hypothetical protein